jgi:hypothetical protein
VCFIIWLKILVYFLKGKHIEFFVSIFVQVIDLD